MPIDCSQCKHHNCCRHVIKELDRGDGTCRYFNEETLKCEIYLSRPHICDTDWMFENIYKERMSREEFDRLNHEACDLLDTSDCRN